RRIHTPGRASSGAPTSMHGLARPPSCSTLAVSSAHFRMSERGRGVWCAKRRRVRVLPSLPALVRVLPLAPPHVPRRGRNVTAPARGLLHGDGRDPPRGGRVEGTNAPPEE